MGQGMPRIQYIKYCLPSPTQLSLDVSRCVPDLVGVLCHLRLIHAHALQLQARDMPRVSLKQTLPAKAVDIKTIQMITTLYNFHITHIHNGAS